MHTLRKCLTVAALCMVALHQHVPAQTATADSSTFTPKVGQSGKDVIWVPTSQALVDQMLNAAKLTSSDYLVDLGSGDGRTVITAAKRGAKARGIEYDPNMVALSKRTAKLEGVDDKATFEHADIFETDFSDATVLTLFLLPDLNIKLRPTILNMKPGTRVLSNSFTMGDWEPDDTIDVKEGCTHFCTAYKWIVPAKVSGAWRLDDKELVLDQSYQTVEGTLRNGSDTQQIRDGRLNGTQLVFKAGDATYSGQVNGNTISGTINGVNGWNASRSSETGSGAAETRPGETRSPS
ncbi:SAM-dependent methyltransferase [Pollutimonas subterranea]|uniref:SAM-dependent methyltransferase n=1 Tax=Pollutimonas subterranea TaxID=2045210 RepID=A0A2N4U9U6_9BURK|nr:class I SAM-dependent methyltransferase [Pollutimonas subterranea]PLC51792.1 SAM-dependent methyltransferase [Pollutimonas subterranea]